jgi:hypothetical protein
MTELVHHGGTENTEFYESELLSSVTSVPPWLEELSNAESLAKR